LPKDLNSAAFFLYYMYSAVCFSRIWMPTRCKLRLRSAKRSESQRSRSRFQGQNAPKRPTLNIAGKKRARQEDVDTDYLFCNFLQFPAFVQRPAREILHRFPPSCPGWNDSSATIGAPMTDEQSYSKMTAMTRGDSREVASSGVARNLVKLNSATNDANDGSDGSSDAGDANTGSNNIGNQDSSRRNTACSRLEHQIQKSHALQPSLDSVPRQPDRARREVVTDTFSYV
jgi:hypothetical protein